MKKTKIKSRMTFLSVFLALALIFTAMPLTASAENEEASAVNTGTSGEYTVSQLANMQVPDEDIPATLTRADIDAKDHAVRLRSEEPNDATVIFQNRDGSKTAYIYMTPVKYTDENGITRDKSSEITAFSGAYNGKHYAYAMKDNDVKVYFSRVGTDGITLSAAGYDIKMIPENTKSLLIPAATLVDENTLRYNGVYGLGTDIEYTSILNGVKENIVLSRYAGVNSYTFMLHTDGLILMNNGADYYLADTAGKRVASIGRVIAEDSAGNTVYGTMTAVTVRAGAQYIVNVAVDEGFLTDEDTVYPVKIDPTVTIDQGDTGYIYDRIQDTGLYETGSGLDGLTDNVYPVGYISSVVGVGRMAIRFPMFVDPWADYMSQFYSGVADIKGYQISSASLSLYAKSVFGITTVKVYPMTSAPSFGMPRREQNTNLMNSYNSGYSGSATVSSAGRKNFDITGIVKLWADYNFDAQTGTLNPIFGLIVKNINENDEMKGVEFYSAYYYDPNYQPELSITYSVPSDEYVFDGGIYGFKSKVALKCITIDESQSNNENVYQYSQNDSLSQAFRTVYDESSGCYKIKAMCSSNGNDKVIGFDYNTTISVSGVYTPANVTLYSDIASNSNNTEWIILPTGSSNLFKIVSRADPNLALTMNAGVYSGGTGVQDAGNIIVSAYTGIPSQHWNIETGGLQITYGNEFVNGATINLARGATYSFITPPVTEFGNTNTWSSSNVSVASVDSNGTVLALGTGSATVTLTVKNSSGTVISTKSVYISVRLDNNTYFLQNRSTRDLMYSSSSTVSQNDYSGATSQKWRLVYSNEYFYIINSSSGLYLTAPSSASENAVVDCQTMSASLSNRQLWKITKLWGETYKIQAKAHENTSWVVADGGSGNVVLKSYTSDGTYNDEWNLCFRTHTIANYYDNGYLVRYNKTTDGAIEDINDYTQAVANRFAEVLGILILFSDATYYNSPVDQCKGTVTLSNIETLCTHEDVKHTDQYHINNEFKQDYPQIANTTNIYWTGHKVDYTSTETGGYNENRSWSSGHAILMLEISTSITNMTGVLMHEMCHQFNAPDHYHEEDDDGNCIHSLICSRPECNAVNARDANCIMYQSRVNITPNYRYCDECIADMLKYIH